jgi:hypothetical protein
MNEDEAFFDLFTPINVVTGALARYRGADLPTMLMWGAGMEIAERAFVHYFGNHLPGGPRDPSINLAVGLMATTLGWWLADCALQGSQSAIKA